MYEDDDGVFKLLVSFFFKGLNFCVLLLLFELLLRVVCGLMGSFVGFSLNIYFCSKSFNDFFDIFYFLILLMVLRLLLLNLDFFLSECDELF